MAIPLRFKDLQIPAEAGMYDHAGDHVKVHLAPETAAELSHKGLGTMVYLYKVSDAWDIVLAPKQREPSRRPKRQEAATSVEVPVSETAEPKGQDEPDPHPEEEEAAD